MGGGGLTKRGGGWEVKFYPYKKRGQEGEANGQEGEAEHVLG